MSLPSYSSYSAAAAVQQALRAAGIIGATLTPSQEAFDWDGTIAAVVSEFEQATKRVPFLAEADPVTLPIVVKRPSQVLNLPASFVAITKVEVVAIGSGADPDELEEGKDYELSPVGADLVDKPFTALVLYPYLTRRTHSKFLVTGRRGYAEKLPPAVYQAVLAMAADRAEGAIRSAQAAEKPLVERKKIGEVETWFATSAGERLRLHNDAQAQWDTAVKRFRKVSIS